MVITAFREEHVDLHDEEKEEMPTEQTISAVKTGTPQGKTKQGVTQVVGTGGRH